MLESMISNGIAQAFIQIENYFMCIEQQIQQHMTIVHDLSPVFSFSK